MTPETPPAGPFRRHRHPRPLRRNDRRWLERIEALCRPEAEPGLPEAELPGSVAARLAGKGAIAVFIPPDAPEAPRWVITDTGRERLREPPIGPARSGARADGRRSSRETPMSP